MNRRMLALALTLLVLSGAAPEMRARADSEQATRTDLPPVVLLHLRHLEETYRVLDVVATRVWPGWTTYRETPFLLEYPNGLRVLIGHPNPPASEFEPVEGVQVDRKKVAVDRRKLLPIPLEGPLGAGGGLIPYGATADGQLVNIVRMTFRSGGKAGAPRPRATETQILMYVHELFHCFQRTHFAPAGFGNLQFNAGKSYATWSEVEGLALQAAYAEADPGQARERLKEFVVARDLKRRSMTDEQQGEESADDVREGTANYSMVRTLEVLREGGFTAGISEQDDPEYGGFKVIAPLLDDHVSRLREATGRVEDPKVKCYDYGSFQALLAQRLFPGWQEAVARGGFIDAEIRKQLPIPDAERADIERRIRERYRADEIQARVASVLDPRDAAWRTIAARRGLVYVIDLKATKQIADSVVPAAGGYRLGIGRLHPSGIEAVRFDDVDLSRVAVPLETAQLYYIRMVDTAPRKGTPGYAIAGQKQADGSYVDATVTTPLFTLKAPRVRVRVSGTRIKVQVLSRVKGG